MDLILEKIKHFFFSAGEINSCVQRVFWVHPSGPKLAPLGEKKPGFCEREKMESLSVCAIWEIACVRSQISLLLFFLPPFFVNATQFSRAKSTLWVIADLLICADAFPHRQSFPSRIFFISINRRFCAGNRTSSPTQFSLLHPPPLSPFIGDRHRTDIFAHTRKTFFCNRSRQLFPLMMRTGLLLPKRLLTKFPLYANMMRGEGGEKVLSRFLPSRKQQDESWSRFSISGSADFSPPPLLIFFGPGFRQIFIFLGA